MPKAQERDDNIVASFAPRIKLMKFLQLKIVWLVHQEQGPKIGQQFLLQDVDISFEHLKDKLKKLQALQVKETIMLH